MVVDLQEDAEVDTGRAVAALGRRLEVDDVRRVGGPVRIEHPDVGDHVGQVAEPDLRPLDRLGCRRRSRVVAVAPDQHHRQDDAGDCREDDEGDLPGRAGDARTLAPPLTSFDTGCGTFARPWPLPPERSRRASHSGRACCSPRAGVAKGLDVARDDVSDTVFARLVGRPCLRATWGAVAAAELAVGGFVLATVLTPWPEAAAAVLLAGAAAIALWGLRHAPDAGCGCFGAGSSPVSVRTTARAGFLAVLAMLAGVGGEGWTAVFGEPAAWVGVVLAGVVVAWLSPELRKAAAERAQEAACRRRVSLERSVTRLRRSELWQRARPYVSADAPSEHWDEGCWRLICYPAVYDGEPATAVFAVSLGLGQSQNRVAFVAEAEQRVLGRLDAR